MCLDPFIAYYYKYQKELKIIGRCRDIITNFGQQNFFTSLSADKKKLIYVKSHLDYNSEKYYEIKLLPCRQCSECRLSRALQWTYRNIIEMQHSIGDSLFITLTYNDENLRYSNFNGIVTLSIPDLQDFLKRLRRFYDYHYNINNIRFYAAGEYGSQTLRPHYHLILYNVDASKLNLNLQQHKSGADDIYISDEFTKMWPYGFHTIQYNNAYSSCYTAGYCTKKIAPHYKIMDLKNDYNFTPEFNTMSRRPALGSQDLNKYIELKKDNCQNVMSIKIGDKIHHVKTIQYYEKKFKDNDFFAFLDYKYNVQDSMLHYYDRFRLFLENTDKDLSTYWQDKDQLNFDKIKSKRLQI